MVVLAAKEVVDAVDTIVAKIAIIKKAKELNIPIISSMGAGNRLDPFQIRVADINQTKNCLSDRRRTFYSQRPGPRRINVTTCY